MLSRRTLAATTALVGVLVLSQSASAQTRANFTLGGLSAFVITPNTPAPGKPWIAYAPSVGGLPAWTGSGAEAWMFDQYFAAGIAVAGIYSGDLSGNAAQRAGYSALYTELVDNRGYAAQFSFHTRSRGGLLGYNWAADNPRKVAAIGGIYSVTNLLSYPGAGTAAAHYGISTTELTTNGHLYNPIDRLASLVANGISVFHIHGDNDGVVPIEDNTQIVKDYFDANGGDATLTVIPGGGHDFNNHWWNNQPLTDFMIAETLAAASIVGPPTLNTLTSVVPADDATDVTVSSKLIASFNEPIDLTGSGTINLQNLSGGADIPITLPGDVTIVGRILTINPASDLVGGEQYAVEISSDAIEDLDDTPNPYAGLLSTDTPNWSFTADNTAPTISGKAPMAGASSIPPASDLTLTFDEDIQAQSGNITIHRDSNDSVVQTIDASSGAVTISDDEVTIDIANLTANTSYYVNIAAGAFKDLSGNPFAGITGDTTWVFTTGDMSGPITLINPSFESNSGTVFASPTGWTATAGNAGWQTFGAQVPQPTDGSVHGFTNGPDASGPGSLSQVVGSEVITDGITYTLTVDIGQISNFTGSEGTIRLIGSGAGAGTPLSNANGTAELSGLTPPSAGPYQTVPVSYTALASGDPFAGQSIGIELVGSSGIQVLWDDVRLTATAPPPTNTFVNWIDGFGLDPADRDFGDDIDGDHLANGVEAWFGTHPGQFDVGVSKLSTNGTTTTFEHPQNEDPPSDLSGYYEWSLNLSDWYASGSGPVAGPTVSFVANTDGTTTTVTATASETLDRLFLRVRVMQN